MVLGHPPRRGAALVATARQRRLRRQQRSEARRIPLPDEVEDLLRRAHGLPPAARASAARYVLMRAAFAPTSLRPTRDLERMSTTALSAPRRVTRITMSSLNPNQRVVAVASIRPDVESTAVISHAGMPAAARCASPTARPAGMGSASAVRSGYPRRTESAKPAG